MYTSQQVGQRRRKKRHSHGLKTVEINRGRNGYGFTISGQHPCVLSCIVGGSPADKIGLKMGDLLMAVNNRDVSQASHDDVVRLIGSSRGVLVLQIAETFNSSESSDEELQMRPKSKYPNRARMRSVGSKRSVDDTALYSQANLQQHSRKDPIEQARLRALSPGRELERRHQEKYNRHHHDMRAMGIENVDPGTGSQHSMVNSKRMSSSDGIIRYRSPNTKHTIITREARLGLTKSQSQSGSLQPPLGGAGRVQEFSGPGRWTSEPRSNMFEDDLTENSFLMTDYMRVIVGYMGTIGMAGDCRNDSSQLQLIQRSVQRLKVERKMTTMVLMELAANGVRLINNMGSTAAMYATEHINYFDVDSADARIFVITTVHVEHVDNSESHVSDSSCHVFKINAELCSHSLHVHKVRNFGIHCTVHPDTGQCMEFPSSAIPIVQYWHRLNRGKPTLHNETNMEPTRSFSGEHAVPRSSHNQSCLGSRQDTQSVTDNRVCVVDMSRDNSRNPESSFRWETDQSMMSSCSNVYHSGEPDVSPILPDAGGRMTKWLNGMSDGSIQVPDTLERLNVRARPNPVALATSNSGPNPHCSTHSSDWVAASKTGSASDQPEPGSRHAASLVSSSGSSSSSVHQARPFRCNSPTGVVSSQNQSKYTESSCQQVSDVSAVSGASVSSMSETSGSSFDVTPVPMSAQSAQSGRPLPRPPFPTRPVPQPPTPNDSQPPKAVCPPVPDRQPIVPRRLPKTPKNPPTTKQKVPRPKSTPPFKELHRNLHEADDDDQSGYDSEPGSVVDSVDKKVLNGQLPQNANSKVIPGTHRFSEGYILHKKIVKLSDEAKKSGSFRHSANKPFRRQPLSSSHESLVISKDELNGNNNSRLHAATSVTTITSKGLVTTDQSNGNLETVGRAASWAVSFDKLLQDKVGIAVFTEFLKKEFSEENIIFWKACQEFKNISDPEERKNVARRLFDKHLSMDASEPVNTDASCRQEVKQMLDSAPPNTFTVAQLQITQLMKQDSYVRFLKSDSYKACVMAEMEGKPLPCPQMSTGGDTNNNNHSSPAPPTPSDRWRKTLKKSRSSTSATDDGGGEEKKRRSLLPWGKNKSDKKMAKMSTDPDLRRNSHEHGQNSKSRPSLELADLNTISKHIQDTLQEIDPKNVTAQESHKFCRVILPDSSTTVILASSGRTIQAALSELCQRRQLILELLLVSLAGDDKPLDMSRDLSSLASRQIILDKLCVFRLDLPQRRYLCVRAKPSQTVAAVFKPVLEKYGLALDQNTVVHVAGTGVILKEDQTVSVLEHKQVIVQSLDDFKEWGSYGSHRNLSSKPPVPKQRSDVYRLAKRLEELIGHMFRDVLDTMANNLDPNNIKFDDNGTWDVTKFKAEESRSSGIFGFIRRNSVGEREGNKAKTKPARTSISTHQNKPQGGSTAALPPQPAAPAPVRGGGKRFDADDERLFELLSRAQSRQLDDQRGLTAHDLELPDFLRVKEEEKPEPSTTSASQPVISSSASATSVPSSRGLSINSTQRTLAEGVMTPRTAMFAMGNSSFSSDGIIPTPNHATTYFMDGTKNTDASCLMDQSLCDLGMTSDLQNQNISYLSFLSGSRSKDSLQPMRVSQLAGTRQPQVPKRRNPPSNRLPEGSSSSQSQNSTPAASEDDLDITLIPPSDSSGDEAALLPSPPRMDQSIVNHPEEANYSPPVPLNIAGREVSQGLHASDRQPARSLSKHLTYSKMVASHVNQSAFSSSSGCDSDIEVEIVGPSGGDHGNQSTPSPTTHDLVFDSGSECSSSQAPSSMSSLLSSCSSSGRLQKNAQNSLTGSKDNVQVSFV